MKKIITMLLAISFSLSLLAVQFEEREWTSTKGDKVKATFVSEKAGSVFLKTPDGKTISIKMSALSAKDKEWIDKETYSPKIFELSPTMVGACILKDKADKPLLISMRDTVEVSFEAKTVSRKTIISNCSLLELGSTLTNKYDEVITTQGRFVCLNWTVKNASRFEYDFTFPRLKDKKTNVHRAVDDDAFVKMQGCHCKGREREIGQRTIKPDFSLDVCNIYEISKDAEIMEVLLFEVGPYPNFYFASTTKYDLLKNPPSWIDNKQEKVRR